MEKTALGLKFLKAAVIYFVVGVTLGAAFTIKPVHDFVMLSDLFAGAHSHVNLLGWVSFTLIGSIYSLLPGYFNRSLYSERLGNISFWLLNTGVAAMVVLLLFAGYTEASLVKAGSKEIVDAATATYMMLIMLFSMVIIVGVYLFAYNVYKTMSSKNLTEMY